MRLEQVSGQLVLLDSLDQMGSRRLQHIVCFQLPVKVNFLPYQWEGRRNVVWSDLWCLASSIVKLGTQNA